MKIRNIDFRAKASVFLLIAAGTLFQSCQQDGVDEWTDGEDELVPIEVQAGITGDVVATRATTTYEKLPDNSTIGIFCMNENNYKLVQDVRYTNTSGTWQPANDSWVVYVGAETAKLCAYYCPSEVQFIDVEGCITATTLALQPYTKEKDLCYAATTTAPVWKGNPQASFNMKHAYARITFTLIRDPGYVGDCKVSSLLWKIDTGVSIFYEKRNMDINSGEFVAGSTREYYHKWNMPADGWADLADPGISISGSAGSKDIDLLFPPQEIEAKIGMVVQLTVDGKLRSVVIPIGPDKTVLDLVAGKQYCITLTLKNTSLELGSVETQNWTEVKVGSGDYEIK